MFSGSLETSPWKQRFGFSQIGFPHSSSRADKLRLLQAWVLSDETLNFKVKDSSRQDIKECRGALLVRNAACPNSLGRPFENLD
jgi:hypothetical protein